MVSAVAILLLLALFATTAHAQTFSIIHSFHSGAFDGDTPYSGVTIRGGTLYGTTLEGGTNCGMGHSCGTVYQLSHAGNNWVERLIYRFPTRPFGGVYPFARVVFGPDGHLYGTASQSDSIYGAVYELIPPMSICRTVACYWSGAGIYSLLGDSDGEYRNTAILSGTSTATSMALRQWEEREGTVFQMSKSGNNWTETTIYKFKLGDEGCYPESGLVMDNNGNFFGTTSSCSPKGNGGVYELTYNPQTGWKETTLYRFTGGTDGGSPWAGLTLDSTGNLYGASSVGTAGATVFELSPSGNTYMFKVPYHFPSGLRGPLASLTLDAAGNLYGTTVSAGTHGLGTIFKLTNTANGWVYASLHDFTGGDDGGYPISNVSIDTDGTLYGTSSGGYGQAGDGIVWMIKP